MWLVFNFVQEPHEPYYQGRHNPKPTHDLKLGTVYHRHPFEAPNRYMIVNKMLGLGLMMVSRQDLYLSI